jgi:hypothetical protein
MSDLAATVKQDAPVTEEECFQTKCPQCGAKKFQRCTDTMVPGQWHRVRIDRVLIKRNIRVLVFEQAA